MTDSALILERPDTGGLLSENGYPAEVAGGDRAPALTHDRLDKLELAMLASSAPAVELPLIHRFTPGLYTREIFMPAGTLLTSRQHETEHPFVVLSGRVRVVVAGEVVEELAAGHVGITQPGTRRLLYIVEDCRWVTFHPNPDNETLEEIERRIIGRRELVDGKTANELYREKLAAQGNYLSGDVADTPELLPGQLDYGGAP